MATTSSVRGKVVAIAGAPKRCSPTTSWPSRFTRTARGAAEPTLTTDCQPSRSASVWTSDKERGERVARQLDVGAVNINDVLANVFSFALPMGGWKQSGVGARWGGASGILKYCRQQAITAPRLPTQSKELLWYPVSPRKVKFAFALMRAAAAHGLRRVGVTPKASKRDR